MARRCSPTRLRRAGGRRDPAPAVLARRPGRRSLRCGGTAGTRARTPANRRRRRCRPARCSARRSRPPATAAPAGGRTRACRRCRAGSAARCRCPARSGARSPPTPCDTVDHRLALVADDRLRRRQLDLAAARRSSGIAIARPFSVFSALVGAARSSPARSARPSGRPTSAARPARCSRACRPRRAVAQVGDDEARGPAPAGRGSSPCGGDQRRGRRPRRRSRPRRRRRRAGAPGAGSCSAPAAARAGCSGGVERERRSAPLSSLSQPVAAVAAVEQRVPLVPGAVGVAVLQPADQRERRALAACRRRRAAAACGRRTARRSRRSCAARRRRGRPCCGRSCRPRTPTPRERNSTGAPQFGQAAR